MKLQYLKINNFKNLRNCEIDFAQPSTLNAIIGVNGSGKSNLIEAILHILIGIYFKKPPRFDFDLRYQAQGRHVSLRRINRTVSIEVDHVRMTLARFVDRL